MIWTARAPSAITRCPRCVVREPLPGRLRLLRAARSMRHDPLELAGDFVGPVEPRRTDREVVVEEEALRILLEGGAKVRGRTGPVLSRERLAGLGHVIDDGRRGG